jgi:hypothetical protein
VIFEIDEEVLLQSVPDSPLAQQISDPMNSSAADTSTMKERIINGDPELFPLIFDFLVRKFHDPEALLRNIELSLDQSLVLDKIEQFLFPTYAPSYVLSADADEVRVAIDPYPSMMTIGQLFNRSGANFLCTDSRFVGMVDDCKKKGEGYAIDEELCAQLDKEYGKIDWEELVQLCELREIPRGELFKFISDDSASGDTTMYVSFKDSGNQDSNHTVHAETPWIVA